MKFRKLFLFLFVLVMCNNVQAQQIIKIVKQYVLIKDLDESSGLSIGDHVSVYRDQGSGHPKKIGEIQIVKFVKGKCAAKIISQNTRNPIVIGDFISLSGDSEATTSSKGPISSDPGDIGIEKGDSEIQFAAFYILMMYKDFKMGNSTIQLSYGRFLTSRLQLGIAPQITMSIFSDQVDTHISASAFVNYNFSSASRLIPYASAQWYQSDFSPEYGDFIDYSYINLGVGLRNFFNQYAALNTSITYGFSLNSDSNGGLLTIMSGLSFIF
ncbi:MAG: hypothetical protein ONB13_01130 [candidate division KSB1 bacterium]|nr:hypothetical protein [candidate division KSB1 bacterium]MDZ7336145.1 hypothetical protein [candidate division KSB1 bacterium]MDZ7357694.1 hypothetical protein [candidate division KSB1 bacterium]MDZ7375196.1 hypothetical protein [candidate division KSB1 bacterium]MDZ7401288.1 hypothetical protein [candidate division KSB1 bacterium]